MPSHPYSASHLQFCNPYLKFLISIHQNHSSCQLANHIWHTSPHCLQEVFTPRMAPSIIWKLSIRFKKSTTSPLMPLMSMRCCRGTLQRQRKTSIMWILFDGWDVVSVHLLPPVPDDMYHSLTSPSYDKQMLHYTPLPPKFCLILLAMARSARRSRGLILYYRSTHLILLACLIFQSV